MTALSGKWKLNSANGKEIANDVEVTFEEDKIHYRYGNNYFGNYEVNGNDLKVGPLAAQECSAHKIPQKETSLRPSRHPPIGISVVTH